MPFEDPIEPSLQLKLQTEKLCRTIKECRDIEILRDIAIELVKLNQNKTAMAQWATRRAAEAEEKALTLRTRAD